MAYGQGNYGGQQRGNPYLWQNPETGEVEYREGDMQEVSPQTAHAHSPIGQAFAASPTNIGTYAAMAFGGLGAANSLGAFGGAVPGANSGAGISNFVGMGVNPAGVGANAAPAMFSNGLAVPLANTVTPATMANAAGLGSGAGGGMNFGNFLGGLFKGGPNGMGNSLGGQLISGGLQGLGQYGQQKSNEKMNERALQNNLHQAVIGDQFNRDLAGAQMAPTGWAQNYSQQTMLKNLMLQKLMNGTSMMPTNPEIMALMPPAFKPTIPEEWAKTNPFGVDMTAQSIQQRQGNLDLLTGGRGPGLNIGAYGGNQNMQNQMDQFRNSIAGTNVANNALGSNPLLSAINMPRPGAQMPGMPTGAQPRNGGMVSPDLLQRYNQQGGNMMGFQSNPYLRGF